MMLAPSGMGEPAFVSGPVLMAERLISGHVVAVERDVRHRPARAGGRAALAAPRSGRPWRARSRGRSRSGGSARDSAGSSARTANPLTGAPGAALLYAFLAILIWPRAQGASLASSAAQASSVAGGSPLGRWARLAWFVLWATMAVLMLAAPTASSSLTGGGGITAAAVTIGFGAAFALAAAGLLVPSTVRPALVVAVIAALALWCTAEGFGEILSGSATDPNTGPLLVLIAATFWPYPRSAAAFTFSRVARMPSRLVRRRARPATLQ